MDTPRQITGLVIPVGDEPAYLQRMSPTLEALQGVVGGFVEALGIDDAVMYFHSEGKYEGLPVNGNATRMAYLADLGLHDDDFIVGPVLVAGVLDAQGRADGADHDVPDSAVDLCRRAGVVVEDRRDG